MTFTGKKSSLWELLLLPLDDCEHPYRTVVLDKKANRVKV